MSHLHVFKRIEISFYHTATKIKSLFNKFLQFGIRKTPGSSGSEFIGHKNMQSAFYTSQLFFTYEIKETTTYCFHSCLISKHIHYFCHSNLNDPVENRLIDATPQQGNSYWEPPMEFQTKSCINQPETNSRTLVYQRKCS